MNTDNSGVYNKGKPLVSVIMNCRNGEKYLRQALESVFLQTYAKWEIIFWDNLSQDKSAEIAKSFGEKVRYFRGTDFVSLGKARNLAINQARGDFISFLDCDDIWMPQKLQRQVELFGKDDAVGLVFSDAINLLQDEKSYFRQFSTLSSLPPKGYIFDYLMLKYGVSMPTVIVKKKALERQMQYFDESFQYSTDYDLFLRIAYFWKVDYVAEPLAVYRIHNSLGSREFGRFEAIERKKTIEKICRLYPEAKKKYRRTISTSLRNIKIIEGRMLWREGKLNNARRIFLKYFYRPKFFLIFLSTFLPYSFITKHWNALRINKKRLKSNAQCAREIIEEFNA